MPDPCSFPSQTDRYGLPYLFAGQAQKEVTVNEIAARIDALMSCTIEALRAAPPASATDGQCWIVGPAATGEWSGNDSKIALRFAGTWQFIAPPDGMVAFDKMRGAIRRYAGTWLAPQRPTLPSAGATIDVEARAALEAIVVVLQTAGLIPEI